MQPILTIKRFNQHHGAYYTQQQCHISLEDVELIDAFFRGRPVIQGFYELSIDSPTVKTAYFTCHPDILGIIKANHKPNDNEKDCQQQQ